ncbi:MAG TPA: DUF433 domain-containing protein [Polyangiaceae bacterium]
MGGRPCIRGLRVTVGAILGLLAAGQTEAEILAAYPLFGAGRRSGCFGLRGLADTRDRASASVKIGPVGKPSATPKALTLLPWCVTINKNRKCG